MDKKIELSPFQKNIGVDSLHLGQSIIAPFGVRTYITKEQYKKWGKDNPYLQKINGRGKKSLFDGEFIHLNAVPIKDHKDHFIYKTSSDFKFEEGTLYRYANFVATYKDNFFCSGFFFVLHGLIFEQSREEVFNILGITK